MRLHLLLKKRLKPLFGRKADFSIPVYKGINTFKAYVSSWYSGELQKIILTPKPDSKVKRMVCSVLAGYTNPIK